MLNNDDHVSSMSTEMIRTSEEAKFFSWFRLLFPAMPASQRVALAKMVIECIRRNDMQPLQVLSVCEALMVLLSNDAIKAMLIDACAERLIDIMVEVARLTPRRRNNK